MGGFLQSPSVVEKNGLKVHLQESFRHKESGNIFQVKEIQKNGLLVILKSSPIKETNLLVGKKAYIQYGTLNEYAKL